jgi:hypothetical protein
MDAPFYLTSLNEPKSPAYLVPKKESSSNLDEQIHLPGSLPQDSPWDQLWSLFQSTSFTDAEGLCRIKDLEVFFSPSQMELLKSHLAKFRTPVCRLNPEGKKRAFAILDKPYIAAKTPRVAEFKQLFCFQVQTASVHLKVTLKNIFSNLLSKASSLDQSDICLKGREVLKILYHENWALALIQSIFERHTQKKLSIPEYVVKKLLEESTSAEHLLIFPNCTQEFQYQMTQSLVQGLPSILKHPDFDDCWSVVTESTAYERTQIPLMSAINFPVHQELLFSAFRDHSENSSRDLSGKIHRFIMTDRPFNRGFVFTQDALMISLKSLILFESTSPLLRPSSTIHSRTLLDCVIAHLTNTLDVVDLTTIEPTFWAATLVMQIKGAIFRKPGTEKAIVEKALAHAQNRPDTLFDYIMQAYGESSPNSLEALSIRAMTSLFENGASERVQNEVGEKLKLLLKNRPQTGFLPQLLLQTMEQQVPSELVFYLVHFSQFLLLNAMQPQTYFRCEGECIVFEIEQEFVVRMRWNKNYFQALLKALIKCPEHAEHLLQVLDYLTPQFPYFCETTSPVKKYFRLLGIELKELELFALQYLEAKTAITQRLGFELLLVCNALNPTRQTSKKILRHLPEVFSYLTATNTRKRLLTSLQNSVSKVLEVEQVFFLKLEKNTRLASYIELLGETQNPELLTLAFHIWSLSSSRIHLSFKLLDLLSKFCPVEASMMLRQCQLESSVTLKQQVQIFNQICVYYRRNPSGFSPLALLSEILQRMIMLSEEKQNLSELHWLFEQMIERKMSAALSLLQLVTEKGWVVETEGLWLAQCRWLLETKGPVVALGRWHLARKLNVWDTPSMRLERGLFLTKLAENMSSNTLSYSIELITSLLQSLESNVENKAQLKALAIRYFQHLISEGDYVKVLKETTSSLGSFFTHQELFQYRLDAFRQFQTLADFSTTWRTLKELVGFAEHDEEIAQLRGILSEELLIPLKLSGLIPLLTSEEFAKLYRNQWVLKVKLMARWISIERIQAGSSVDELRGCYRLLFNGADAVQLKRVEHPFLRLVLDLLSSISEFSKSLHSELLKTHLSLILSCESSSSQGLRFDVLKQLVRHRIAVPQSGESATKILNLVSNRIQELSTLPNFAEAKEGMATCESILMTLNDDRVIPCNYSSLQLRTLIVLVSGLLKFYPNDKKCVAWVKKVLEGAIDHSILSDSSQQFMNWVPCLVELREFKLAAQILVLIEAKFNQNENEFTNQWLKITSRAFELGFVDEAIQLLIDKRMVIKRDRLPGEIATLISPVIESLLSSKPRTTEKLNQAAFLISFFIPSDFRLWDLIFKRTMTADESVKRDGVVNAWAQVAKNNDLGAKDPEKLVIILEHCLNCLSKCSLDTFTSVMPVFLTCRGFFSDRLTSLRKDIVLKFSLTSHELLMVHHPRISGQTMEMLATHYVFNFQLYRSEMQLGLSEQEARTFDPLKADQAHLDRMGEWILTGHEQLMEYGVKSIEGFFSKPNPKLLFKVIELIKALIDTSKKHSFNIETLKKLLRIIGPAIKDPKVLVPILKLFISHPLKEASTELILFLLAEIPEEKLETEREFSLYVRLLFNQMIRENLIDSSRGARDVIIHPKIGFLVNTSALNLLWAEYIQQTLTTFKDSDILENLATISYLTLKRFSSLPSDTKHRVEILKLLAQILSRFLMQDECLKFMAYHRLVLFKIQEKSEPAQNPWVDTHQFDQSLINEVIKKPLESLYKERSVHLFEYSCCMLSLLLRLDVKSDATKQFLTKFIFENVKYLMESCYEEDVDGKLETLIYTLCINPLACSGVDYDAHRARCQSLCFIAESHDLFRTQSIIYRTSLFLFPKAICDVPLEIIDKRRQVFIFLRERLNVDSPEAFFHAKEVFQSTREPDLVTIDYLATCLEEFSDYVAERPFMLIGADRPLFSEMSELITTHPYLLKPSTDAERAQTVLIYQKWGHQLFEICLKQQDHPKFIPLLKHARAFLLHGLRSSAFFGRLDKSLEFVQNLVPLLIKYLPESASDEVLQEFDVFPLLNMEGSCQASYKKMRIEQLNLWLICLVNQKTKQADKLALSIFNVAKTKNFTTFRNLPKPK